MAMPVFDQFSFFTQFVIVVLSSVLAGGLAYASCRLQFRLVFRFCIGVGKRDVGVWGWGRIVFNTILPFDL